MKLKTLSIFTLSLGIMLLVSNKLEAQLYRKQWLVGASFNGNYSSTTVTANQISSPNQSKSLSISTPIGVGYFVTNKWAVGIRSNYGFSKTENTYTFNDYFSTLDQTIVDQSKQFLIGGFTRFYFLPKQNRFNIYCDAGYNYGELRNTAPDVFATIKQLTTSIAPVFIINKHVSLEFIFSYVRQSTIIKSTSTPNNAFLFGIGFQAHLGNPTKSK